jgi:histidinol dehydrogenase
MMRLYRFPERQSWDSLASRPEIKRVSLDKVVSEIIENVRTEGDSAVRKYSKDFDGISLQELKVSEKEIKEAASAVPDDLKAAIELARMNIEKFHKVQVVSEPATEIMAGVRCWRKSIPLGTAGIYIPGGTAPLFSTILMLAIPAKVAGCTRVVMCTPPSKDGNVNPVLLYTASLTGIDDIYKAGGAQAIAAMAFGTETIPVADKIFGPGNQYVTRAKQLIQLFGVAIDMPAGPSEVLVIADKLANPEFIASDLLAQAEHGTDSQVVFLTDNEPLIKKVEKEIALQIGVLPRREIAAAALENSFSVLLKDMGECIDFSNHYSPEHLIISAVNAGELAEKVRNAGSVFIGEFSCESAGDYASGTNHTLPTNGYARSYSGVSVESFVKKVTFQELTREGLEKIGKAIEIMAGAENLAAHKNAVTIRLKDKENEQSR